MKKVQRFSTKINGVKEIGFLDEDRNFVTISDLVNHISINVFETLREIENGEKKAEETNIDLEISALNSLSNALNAISNYSKKFQ